MPNRLADAVSPYLRSHADNPVDWWPWGDAAFAEARRREVPVLVSIGYSTCHWCHVMARESFSDPELARELNENFVAIKVDREEHPDVDASYLLAASAFTSNLGWPLNVFVTPRGRAFFAGTYFPPQPLRGQPSFRQALEAVTEAWAHRRDQLEQTGAEVAAALLAQAGLGQQSSPLPHNLEAAVERILEHEDAEYGGFGTAPKFPVAPVMNFLLEEGASETAAPSGSDAAVPSDGSAAVALAERSLRAMADSPLRDPVEGGFFRYSTLRDWGEPHYERMLYDNAQLLEAYARLSMGSAESWAAATAEGVAGFLCGVLQLSSGGFASAQDSESTVGGVRVEGGYYALSASERAAQLPPALDEKVLSGWNGLAIGALARASVALARPEWAASARRAADYLLSVHLRADGLVRASIGGRVSTATATLEDYGMLASGLAELALATGEARYASAARALIDETLAAAAVDSASGLAFAVPGGPDPVLVAQGLALAVDPSEGAYPSGLSACAHAAHMLYLLTGDRRYLEAAEATARLLSAPALSNPLGFGASLALISRLVSPPVQLVVVTGAESAASAALQDAARGYPAQLTAIVSEAQATAFADEGFELFEGRVAQQGETTAYLCRDFVCRLPATEAAGLGL